MLRWRLLYHFRVTAGSLSSSMTLFEESACLDFVYARGNQTLVVVVLLLLLQLEQTLDISPSP